MLLYQIVIEVDQSVTPGGGVHGRDASNSGPGEKMHHIEARFVKKHMHVRGGPQAVVINIRVNGRFTRT